MTGAQEVTVQIVTTLAQIEEVRMTAVILGGSSFGGGSSGGGGSTDSW